MKYAVVFSLIFSIFPFYLCSQTAYITNAESGTISVIDLQSNQVIHNISVGGSPTALSVAPDGMKVYVTDFISDAVIVVDAISNTVDTAIVVGGDPFGILVSPFDEYIYATSFNGNTLSRIHPETYEVDKISVTRRPFGIAVSPTEPSLVTTHFDGGNRRVVSIVNTNIYENLYNIQSGNVPLGIIFSADGKKLYVANNADDTVSIIDVDTEEKFDIKLGSAIRIDPYDLVLNADESKLYVSNQFENTVSVINTATREVEATIPVGVEPYGIDISPDGRSVYVVCADSDAVYVINTLSNEVIDVIPVQNSPRSFGNFISNYTNTCNFREEISDCEVVDTQEFDIIPFEVFPNPTKDFLTFKGTTPKQVNIIDAYGRLVLSQKNKAAINLSAFPDGIYIVQANIGDAWMSQKVVKQ
ncbi:MAG: T9SS type A sorting domain-containing protein [Bacteroidota bacterium]